MTVAQFLVIFSLAFVCQSFGDNSEDELLISEERWPHHSQVMTAATVEKFEAIGKQLLEKSVELAKSIEREKSAIEKIELQKTLCETQTQALQAQAKLMVASEQSENHLKQKNSDLRLELVQQNASFHAQILLDKWLRCENRINSSISEVEKNSPKLSQKLIHLSTGFYYISYARQKENWYMASKICKSYGMELASVETKEENDALLKEIAKLKDNFYISGTDLGSEGQFYWASTGKPFGIFSDWTGNNVNPNNAGGSEHCVHYWHNKAYGEKQTWNDVKCDHKLRFICELME